MLYSCSVGGDDKIGELAIFIYIYICCISVVLDLMIR